MNEFGEALLKLLEERGMTVPDLAEEMREKCCGRVCYCRKLSAWDIAGMMTVRYLDEVPNLLYLWHFDLLEEVLGLRRDEEDVDLQRLLSKSMRCAPVYRPLFERAEKLVPYGLLEKATPEEAAQVLRTHGEEVPEHVDYLLKEKSRGRKHPHH